MELRDYGRILRRRRHVIYWTFAIVAVVSVLLVGLSAYSSYNLVQESLVITEDAPTPSQLASQVHGLNSVPWDPAKESLSLAVDVVNSAFNYTDTRAYLDAVSARLSTSYGVHKTWQDLQATLIIYPAALNHMFFKVNGSPANDATSKAIVTAAAGVVADYVNTVYHTLYPAGAPPHAGVWDPLNVQKAAHLTKSAGDLAIRFAGGLILGLILALLWEYLDDYAHDERDVEHMLGAPVLAAIPALTR